jgi:hypothetical protein
VSDGYFLLFLFPFQFTLAVAVWSCWTVRVSNPGRHKIFFRLRNVWTGSGSDPASNLTGTDVLLLGWIVRVVTLTTHLYPLLRLSMSGAIPLLPLCTNLHCLYKEAFTLWVTIIRVHYQLFFLFPAARPTSSYTVTWKFHNLALKPNSAVGWQLSCFLFCRFSFIFLPGHRPSWLSWDFFPIVPGKCYRPFAAISFPIRVANLLTLRAS